MIKNKIVKNASWIIGVKIFQAILGLIISMLTARYLGPSGFGVISYAASVVAFVVPIMQLGMSNILVKEMVDDPLHEGEILGTALVLNLISSISCVIGVTCFASVANRGEQETIIVCALYSITLVAQASEILIYWFQAKLLSKYTSIISLVAYFVVSLYKVFLLATDKSVFWFAISQSIDFAIIAIALFVTYKKLGGTKLSFSGKRAKLLFSQSRHYIISSMMVTVFAQTDRIMLKLMIDDAATGYYSAAVTCAGMTSFVFAAIIDSVRPSVFENKKISKEKYEKSIVRLYSIIIYMSLTQSVVMTLFSELIIGVLYGNAYVPAISALRIVVWYTTFSYMGAVRNIWILAEKKQRYLWIINLSGALMNVALNAILIPRWNIIGASVASLITQIFTNFILGYVIRPIRHNNTLMIKAFDPRQIVSMFKQIILVRNK